MNQNEVAMELESTQVQDHAKPVKPRKHRRHKSTSITQEKQDGLYHWKSGRARCRLFEAGDATTDVFAEVVNCAECKGSESYRAAYRHRMATRGFRLPREQHAGPRAKRKTETM